MITVSFLAEWALRSAILILSGAALLWMLRVKDASIRLAGWTAVLAGSMAIPALTALLPRTPVAVVPAITLPAAPPEPAGDGAAVPAGALVEPGISRIARAALGVYSLIAFALLLRIAVGAALGLRILRRSVPSGQSVSGVELRESASVTAPVALGVFRPAIVLPADWREWSAAKLDAVVAHERSHIARFDPAVQLGSAIHRALLWFSPLSWFLHQRIVRAAEEASDDAAVAAIHDRALYAETLLDFIGRGVRRANGLGVPMARYGSPEDRIRRVLNGHAISRGITRWSLAAIAGVAAPVIYVAAATHPVRAQQAPPPAAPSSREVLTQPVVPQPPAAPPAAAQGSYLAGMGEVTAFNTVVVKPRIDGQLTSVVFKEGQAVTAGQLLATLDGQPFELLLSAAQRALEQDQADLRAARIALERYRNLAAANVIPREQADTAAEQAAQLESRLKIDQAKVEEAKIQLSYTRITAPISGIVGLRQIDAGNMAGPSDSKGIVTITQIQPIAVVFTIPEDSLPQVLERLREGAHPVAEAWNRDASKKLATGRLIAADNQIDPESGTAKLKAEFDNKDGALFPIQFVNVRVFLDTR